MKNRYLNLSAALKFTTNQNKQKRAEAKPQTATIHDQFFLTMFRQVLAIPLLTEEALFTWVFRRLSFTFSVFTRVQGSVSIKAATKANIWLHAHYCK